MHRVTAQAARHIQQRLASSMPQQNSFNFLTVVCGQTKTQNVAKNVNGCACYIVSRTYKCAWLPSARQGTCGRHERRSGAHLQFCICGVETPQHTWRAHRPLALLSMIYGSAGGRRRSLSKSEMSCIRLHAVYSTSKRITCSVNT
jgi:hypothetical protein